MRLALLWICCLSAVAARSSVGAAGPDEPSEGVHLRSGYFASRRQQKTPRDVLVTYTRTRQSADGDVVEVLSTEKLVPISDDDVDDLVEVIAAERKLQDTQAEGIREVYKKPNKNYNNPKKKSSSSSSKSKSRRKARNLRRRVLRRRADLTRRSASRGASANERRVCLRRKVRKALQNRAANVRLTKSAATIA